MRELEDTGGIANAHGARGLRVVTLIALLALAALGSAQRAGSVEPMAMPPMASIERGAYQARDARTGAPLWQAEWTVQQERRDGRPILQGTEDGWAEADSSLPPAWTVNMQVDFWGSDPRFASMREARDARGRPVAVEQRQFDYARAAGEVVTTDLRTGTRESKQVRLTLHTITFEMLPVVLRILPEAPNREMRFDVVTRGGRVLGFVARIVGRERVTVPAGSFDCYKVELAVTGIYGVLADLVLPKLYMWQTEVAPHFWVKYQGPEAGPGSREIVRELVRFEAGSLRAEATPR